MTAPGRFVWHDLMTTDLERSKSFYSGLLGFSYNDLDLGEMGTYPMIRTGDRDIGGMVAVEAAPGATSRWVAYVTVDDVDAAAARAAAAGGAVRIPPTPIPNVGRFAELADPQGAVISAFVSTNPDMPEPGGPPPLGIVCWNELLTTDPAAAVAFYQTVFGWGHGTMDMGPAGVYHLFKREDKDVAGMMQMPPDAAAPPLWMPYFLVADVDASFASALSLGAMPFVKPADIPEVGRFAVLGDPTGASFALFKDAKA
jgi:predicted enzyme related to lactoylglutathione lyase